MRCEENALNYIVYISASDKCINPFVTTLIPTAQFHIIKKLQMISN